MFPRQTVPNRHGRRLPETPHGATKMQLARPWLRCGPACQAPGGRQTIFWSNGGEMVLGLKVLIWGLYEGYIRVIWGDIRISWDYDVDVLQNHRDHSPDFHFWFLIIPLKLVDVTCTTRDTRMFRTKCWPPTTTDGLFETKNKTKNSGWGPLVPYVWPVATMESETRFIGVWDAGSIDLSSGVPFDDPKSSKNQGSIAENEEM